MLLGTLGSSLLGNMLTGKGILRAGHGSKKPLIKGLQSNDLRFKKGKGNIRTGYGCKVSSIKDF